MNSRSDEDIAAGLFVTFAGMLLAIGTLMVYSSSMTAMPSEEEQILLSRQLVFLFAAAIVGSAVCQLPSRIWKQGAWLLYAVTLLLLVLVLVPGLGRVVNGAQRWFRLGSISIQPSETAKLTVPLMLCALRFGSRTGDCWSWRAMSTYAVLTVFPVVCIALEPDLGTAVFVGLTAAMALWLGGCPLRYFLSAGLVGGPAAAAVLALKPYQLARIRGFIDTWVHPEAAPYQIQQSLTTLGVGGAAGVGLGQGWQKLSFLPEANTDFVFAVIGEELGLVGTLGVLLLWIGFYVSGTCLIRRVPRGSFEQVLASTLLAQLVLQAAVNMAVVLALLPPKGISHPFISYGGSNLVVSIVSVGLILSLTRLPNGMSIGDKGGQGPAQPASMESAINPHALSL